MFCIVSVRGGTWGAGGPHGRRGAVGRGATAPALVWFLRPSAWRRAGDGGQEPWRNAAGSRGTSGLGGSRDTGAPGCRSGGRPHPGDRSVMPLEHTVFHARPRVCDAGLVPDTPTTKDGGLGAQEVRARFPVSYRAHRGRIATLGRGRVSRGPPAPGLLPCPTVVDGGDAPSHGLALLLQGRTGRTGGRHGHRGTPRHAPGDLAERGPSVLSVLLLVRADVSESVDTEGNPRRLGAGSMEKGPKAGVSRQGQFLTEPRNRAQNLSLPGRVSPSLCLLKPWRRGEAWCRPGQRAEPPTLPSRPGALAARPPPPSAG